MGQTYADSCLRVNNAPADTTLGGGTHEFLLCSQLFSAKKSQVSSESHERGYWAGGWPGLGNPGAKPVVPFSTPAHLRH